MAPSLDRVRREGLFSDFQVTLGSKSFPCHKVVLAGNSDALYQSLTEDPQMFSMPVKNIPNGMMESAESTKCFEDAMDIVLSVLYNQGVISKEQKDTMNNQFMILQAAVVLTGALNLEIVGDSLAAFISEEALNINTAIPFLHLAHVSSNQKLLEAVSSFVTTHFFDLTNFEADFAAAAANLSGLALVPTATLSAILKSEGLQVPHEEHVLDCVRTIIGIRSDPAFAESAKAAADRKPIAPVEEEEAAPTEVAIEEKPAEVLSHSEVPDNQEDGPVEAPPSQPGDEAASQQASDKPASEKPGSVKEGSQKAASEKALSAKEASMKASSSAKPSKAPSKAPTKAGTVMSAASQQPPSTRKVVEASLEFLMGQGIARRPFNQADPAISSLFVEAYVLATKSGKTAALPPLGGFTPSTLAALKQEGVFSPGSLLPAPQERLATLGLHARSPTFEVDQDGTVDFVKTPVRLAVPHAWVQAALSKVQPTPASKAPSKAASMRAPTVISQAASLPVGGADEVVQGSQVAGSQAGSKAASVKEGSQRAASQKSDPIKEEEPVTEAVEGSAKQGSQLKPASVAKSAAPSGKQAPAAAPSSTEDEEYVLIVRVREETLASSNPCGEASVPLRLLSPALATGPAAPLVCHLNHRGVEAGSLFLRLTAREVECAVPSKTDERIAPHVQRVGNIAGLASLPPAVRDAALRSFATATAPLAATAKSPKLAALHETILSRVGGQPGATSTGASPQPSLNLTAKATMSLLQQSTLGGQLFPILSESLFAPTQELLGLTVNSATGNPFEATAVSAPVTSPKFATLKSVVGGGVQPLSPGKATYGLPHSATVNSSVPSAEEVAVAREAVAAFEPGWGFTTDASAVLASALVRNPDVGPGVRQAYDEADCDELLSAVRLSALPHATLLETANDRSLQPAARARVLDALSQKLHTFETNQRPVHSHTLREQHSPSRTRGLSATGRGTSAQETSAALRDHLQASESPKEAQSNKAVNFQEQPPVEEEDASPFATLLSAAQNTQAFPPVPAGPATGRPQSRGAFDQTVQSSPPAPQAPPVMVQGTTSSSSTLRQQLGGTLPPQQQPALFNTQLPPHMQPQPYGSNPLQLPLGGSVAPGSTVQSASKSLMRMSGPHASRSASSSSFAPQREFVFESLADTNGLLFHLGSRGRTRLWQNPAAIGAVSLFSSGVGFGRLEDLVGRAVNSLRTSNEPSSFLGLDLGEGRRFQVQGYVLRNRDSTSHCLISWQLQGSHDGSQWSVLDEKVNCQALRGACAAVYVPVGVAISPGQTQQQAYLQSTLARQERFDGHMTDAMGFYGVRQAGSPVNVQEGFRFFRIVQLGKNSSGSFNLVLSTLELYGKAVEGNFI